MAPHSGQFYTLGIGRQSAKGTPQTTPLFKLRLTGGIVLPDPQIIDLPETDSSIQRSKSAKVGQQIGGAIEGLIRADELAFLAYAGLGATGVTGASPYVHTATASPAPPYFTLYSAFDGSALVDRYVDCRVPELVIRGGSGQALGYSASFLGTTATHGETDPGAPAPSDVDPLTYPDVTVTLGASTADIVTGFELTSNKGGFPIQGDTGMDVSDIALGRWGVTGFLDVLFETDQKWRAWLTNSPTGTTTSPVIFTEDLTITASRAAADNEVSMIMAAVELRRVGLAPNPNGEPLSMRYEFSAQPQPAIADTLSIVCKNLIAAL